MDEYLKNVLLRGGDPFRPSLENRVAYQSERDASLISALKDRRRNSVIFRTVDTALDAYADGARVLDIGCAYGNHIFMLNARHDKNQSFRFTGIDIDPDALRFAVSFSQIVPGYDNCDFMMCDAESGLCFAGESFDLALCSDVLEHWQDPARALDEIARVLKPGGRLLVTSPLRSSLFKSVSAALNALSIGRIRKKYLEGKPGSGAEPEHGHGHVSEMSLSGYIAAARSAGLKPVRVYPANVFSGSLFFDRRPFLLAALFFIEALHSVFRFVSWGHGVQILFEKEYRRD